MKFWQLHSVMSAERAPFEAVLAQPEWESFRHWDADYDRLVETQDRAKLDAPVPDALVRAVLRLSRQVFFLQGGILRSYRFTPDDEEISALAAYEMVGGGLLEDVLEKGSVRAH